MYQWQYVKFTSQLLKTSIDKWTFNYPRYCILLEILGTRVHYASDAISLSALCLTEKNCPLVVDVVNHLMTSRSLSYDTNLVIIYPLCLILLGGGYTVKKA